MTYTVKDLERFVAQLNKDDWADSLYRLKIEHSAGGYSLVAELKDPARITNYLKRYKHWAVGDFVIKWRRLNYRDLDNGGHTRPLETRDRYFKACYYDKTKIDALQSATSPARLYKLYMAGKI